MMSKFSSSIRFCCILAASAFCCTTAGSAEEESTPAAWEISPYRVQVLTAVEEGVSIPLRFEQDLQADLPARTASVVGGAWRLEAASAPTELRHRILHSIAGIFWIGIDELRTFRRRWIYNRRARFLFLGRIGDVGLFFLTGSDERNDHCQKNISIHAQLSRLLRDLALSSLHQLQPTEALATTMKREQSLSHQLPSNSHLSLSRLGTTAEQEN